MSHKEKEKENMAFEISLDEELTRQYKAVKEYIGIEDNQKALVFLVNERYSKMAKSGQGQKRAKFSELFGGELKMIPVTVELCQPYVKFLKQYMEFFGVQNSVEIFCMKLIYDEVGRLHRDLTEFIESKDAEHFIDGKDWFNRNPHVAVISDQGPDEQE